MWRTFSSRWIALGWSLWGCADDPAQPPLPFSDGPCETPGFVCTWLGTPGVAGFADDPAQRTATTTYYVSDVAFAPDGTAYLADLNNHRIRRVGVDGIVTTVSGTGFLGDGPVDAPAGCWSGCDLAPSRWIQPSAVAVDPNDPDRLWVAGWHTGRVSAIDLAASTMTWWAGVARSGPIVDAPRGEVVLVLPSGIAAAADGALFVADAGSHTLRRIDVDGTVHVIAGEAFRPAYDGDGGPASDAHLHGALGPGSKLALTPDERALILADTQNGVVRRLYLDTGWVERVAGVYASAGDLTAMDPTTGTLFTSDLGAVVGYAGDGGDALDAVFAHPNDVAVGADGEIFVADTDNDCVREILADGTIVRFAGRCGESGMDGDGGPAIDATFDGPLGVAVGPDGAVYVADSNNHTIRRIPR